MNIRRYKGIKIVFKGVRYMNKTTNIYKPLDSKKKEILKSLMGSASSKKIDFNKVRDEWKYGEN